MGFLNNLFGNNKNLNSNIFLTNAGDFGFGQIDLDNSKQIQVDALLAIGKFKEAAEKQNKKFAFQVMYSQFLDNGVLTIPLVFTLDDKKFSVFFIYNQQDLGIFKDAQKYVSQTEYPNLIYFSALPINKSVQQQSAVAPFQFHHLTHNPQYKPEGKYAMWWATDDDKVFHKSEAYKWLSGIYEITKDYESYIAGFILQQLGLSKDKNLSRILLPEKNYSIVLEGPNHKKIILDLSQEKGIRFLFSTENASKKYVNQVLEGIMINLIVLLKQLKDANVEKDPKREPNSYDWFTFMTDVVKKEKNNDDLHIGVVEFNN